MDYLKKILTKSPLTLNTETSNVIIDVARRRTEEELVKMIDSYQAYHPYFSKSVDIFFNVSTVKNKKFGYVFLRDNVYIIILFYPCYLTLMHELTHIVMHVKEPKEFSKKHSHSPLFYMYMQELLDFYRDHQQVFTRGFCDSEEGVNV